MTATVLYRSSVEATVLDLLIERLDETKADNRTTDLVLAACMGDAALDATVSGDAVDRPKRSTRAAASAAHAYLAAIDVEGFRGIGPRSRLALEPGPGLTLVVGRNGSGKSSFAEAAELLLTGENRRWSGRPTAWQDGWRNLHHSTTAIEVDLLADGQPGSTTVRGAWTTTASLEDVTTSAQSTGGARIDDVVLDHAGPIRVYRPFLSYNELGSMLEDRPSDLYDALEAVLGLEELGDASERLRQRRLADEKLGKEVAKQIAALAKRCAALDDERATRAHVAISAKPRPDLAALAAVVGDGSDDRSGDLDLLRQLCNLRGPDWKTAATMAIDIRSVAKEAARLSGTDAGKAKELADLLGAALQVHEHHGDTACPVCGAGTLDDHWRQRATEQAATLRAEATEASHARRALLTAVDTGKRLLVEPPPFLARAEDVGINAEPVRLAWASWASFAVDEPLALADHLDEVQSLTEAITSIPSEAEVELERRQDAWKPIRLDLSAWLVGAQAALDADRRAKEISRAEKWMKDAAADLRDQRFAPIADAARALWATLRQQSNVELGRIELEGAATRRRVSLDVTVDGTPAGAIGVMSQGELHALALSLFLPRATSADSPFRFVVIDDPVQAMDPARVDGLARVLEQTSRSHQVIVFSHDDRLPESVRRQQIPARVLQVQRRSDSRVDVQVALDPIGQLIDDAKALANTDDLPAAAARRVVPGFLRAALEAACNDAIRRRDLAAGVPHAEVEATILAADALTKRLALALHGDSSKHTSVMNDIQTRFGKSKADVIRRVNKGSHEGDEGDLWGLALNAEAARSRSHRRCGGNGRST